MSIHGLSGSQLTFSDPSVSSAPTKPSGTEAATVAKTATPEKKEKSSDLAETLKFIGHVLLCDTIGKEGYMQFVAGGKSLSEAVKTVKEAQKSEGSDSPPVSEITIPTPSSSTETKKS